MMHMMNHHPPAVIILVAAIVCTLIVATGGQEQASIFINAGGRSYTDSFGNQWESDDANTYYNTGDTFRELFWIFGTDDKELYRSNRYDADDSPPELIYNITEIQNGNYDVSLHFAELYTGAQSNGARVFSVKMEEEIVFEDLDVYKEAGGYTVLIKEAFTTVNDGALTIEFVSKNERPMVSAIETHVSDVPYTDPEAGAPTVTPSGLPSQEESSEPSESQEPSFVPSESPSRVGSSSRTSSSQVPSTFPSDSPSQVGSSSPTSSDVPSTFPSDSSSRVETAEPPKLQPPSDSPSLMGSVVVTVSSSPSMLPSSDDEPSPVASAGGEEASESPSEIPTSGPSSLPTESNVPSAIPTESPTLVGTASPSNAPSEFPSEAPSQVESSSPSMSNFPTESPSGVVSEEPSQGPSNTPSGLPSSMPSERPSDEPSFPPSSQPSDQPSGQPSGEPSSMPSSLPSSTPSVEPSEEPSCLPSESPSDVPSSTPSSEPSSLPSSQPSDQPSAAPSSEPSSQPSSSPRSDEPSVLPSEEPSSLPSRSPSHVPSSGPSSEPTSIPSSDPSSSPSNAPSWEPSDSPSSLPSAVPSLSPSNAPSEAPSALPSALPSHAPSDEPSDAPSVWPSARPSDLPTSSPSAAPSSSPSSVPSDEPSTHPSAFPSDMPSKNPSDAPSPSPTARPSGMPSTSPSAAPSSSPSNVPSNAPSTYPSDFPSDIPSKGPSNVPSTSPSTKPSNVPSGSPSDEPSSDPSPLPSERPSAAPTLNPTENPSTKPSDVPSAVPSLHESDEPSSSPSAEPSSSPSDSPTGNPTELPTSAPTTSPTESPTEPPTDMHTASPTEFPTESPSENPTCSPTKLPTVSPTQSPTKFPTLSPTSLPTQQPTNSPTESPTELPTDSPTARPTEPPTSPPTKSPSDSPTGSPTKVPSHIPTNLPTEIPTSSPPDSPTVSPTTSPSDLPTIPKDPPTPSPTDAPTKRPTALPTESPTDGPTSTSPSHSPSNKPTVGPSGLSSTIPSEKPSTSPTSRPSEVPTPQPTNTPTATPSQQPTYSATSTTPSSSASSEPFGVNGFMLVNADSNEDVEGALDCDPINECFGSARNFNVRASVFGDVAGVAMTLDGPVSETRTESVAPFAVFGDANGNYKGNVLTPGIYSITAFALNGQDRKSQNFTKAFKVQVGRTPAPTFEPTNSSSSLAPSAQKTSPTPKPSAVTTQRPSPSPTQPPTPLALATSTAAEDISIRINAGGSAFIDTSGNKWEGDAFFHGGRTHGAAPDQQIALTNDDELYRSERWIGSGDRDLFYDIPVPNGVYSVTLHFAEIYPGAQAKERRVFDVYIDSMVAFKNLDIYDKVGGYAALKIITHTQVSDGKISVDLRRVPQKNNPKLSGIEIVSTSSLFINCGGTSFTDKAGNIWEPDSYYNSGSVFVSDESISGSVDDAIYQSERYGKPAQILKYDIPVPNGEYVLTLHFSETYVGAIGGRVFDVDVEDKIAIERLDIFEEVGGFAALSKTLSAFVTDGQLTIGFLRHVQNPTVSGIEVHSSVLYSSLIQQANGALSAPTPAPVNPSQQLALAPAIPQPSPRPTPLPTTSGRLKLPTATAITVSPTPGPTSSPTKASVSKLEPIRINAGGPAYTDFRGRSWRADTYFNAGGVFGVQADINGTSDPKLYQSERYDKKTDPDLLYSIPVPNGNYLVTLHFAEIFFQEIGARVFDVVIESFGVVKDLDIYSEVGSCSALTKVSPTAVSDGELTIEFLAVEELPKISAIEVEVLGTAKAHQSHAVPGGPYFGTDTDGDSIAQVKVDGTFSHTHGPGARIFSWKWYANDTYVGSGEVATLDLAVGSHHLVLEVTDTDMDVSRDYTSVMIRDSSFPDIFSLSPSSGDISGSGTVVILGSGFTASESDTTVHFGPVSLSGPSELRVVDGNRIEVKDAPPGFAGKVHVTVQTPIGTSMPATYQYKDGIPLAFKSNTLVRGIYGPTCVAAGPDGNIYVGTYTGAIIKLELNDKHEVVRNVTSYAVATSSTAFRSILGITFDPMDTSPNPAVYVSHSTLFHGKLESYNGKVSKVSGKALENIKDVVTGLPVSDLDHAVNGLEFGDNGELYIQVGGNTNAGVPGALSSSGKQVDGLFSAATLVAHLSRPSYDGNVRYDSNSDQISGFDVELFASGERNPFGIALHSNGKLYGTDNGPNFGFGERLTKCSDDETDNKGPDPSEPDKLNLIEQGKYYGHANKKRGETDPRQCTWRSNAEQSDGEYTPPLMVLPSSTNGIIEFSTDHFAGKLRGHLILGRYKGALYNVPLSNDGQSVTKKFPSILAREGGIGLVQGPDGTLFVARNDASEVRYHTPDEAPSLDLEVKSVFPRRGPESGGSLLSIYGENLAEPRVEVGGKVCPLVGSSIGSKITCRLPSGIGKADVVVSSGEETVTFAHGYRYIRGRE